MVDNNDDVDANYTIYFPNEIWCIILDYLKCNEAKELLKYNEMRYREKETLVLETFDVAIERMMRSTKHISKSCHSIERKTIGCDNDLHTLCSCDDEIDDDIIRLRWEIQSLQHTIKQLQDTKREFILRGYTEILNPIYEEYIVEL